jgi:hypothetical protein
MYWTKANSERRRVWSSSSRGLGEELTRFPSSPQGKHMSRSSGVEATESMVIDMPNDESDDELLLDNKGWNWDGRWD